MSETIPEYGAHAPTEHAPRITPAVQWLIAINVAVYFIQLAILKPADVQLALGFQTKDLGHQWWTIGTYMFVHDGFWHLALNMYTLWLFGPRIEWKWGAREFTRFYLFCGLGGWFAHLAFVPGDSLLIGASAAVFGVMLAYASLWPDEQLFVFGVIPTTVRWLVIFLGVLNIVGGITTAGALGGIAYFAHVGGLAAGWLYLRMTAAVNIDRLRQSVSPVPDEPEDVPPRAVPRTLPRTRARERDNIDDVVARSNAAVAKQTPAPRAARTQQTELNTLDQLLDKISAQGIESLTADERRVLAEESKRRRTE
ncbi:MAG TPA: rhomboid family intramembrane serine protease [Gemmatimonadaceae bacterium]|jgi:membrane associated rhomboid family serine protease|nr:rhomboid family intramembrane serine protease [Gemmatimonadaceae bacterium]